MKQVQQDIVLFHRHNFNRKAIKELMAPRFQCHEIELWNELKRVQANVYVIFEPELLIPRVSIRQIKKSIGALQGKVIVIPYDESSTFRNNRNTTVLPDNPSTSTLLNTLESLLKPN